MKSRKVIIFNLLLICYLVVFSMVTVSKATAAEYYIAPASKGGSDSNGDGTKYKPWATLSHAQTAVSAGDTIYVRGGTFTTTGVKWTRSGSAGKEIIIKAYPGESPKFNGGLLSTRQASDVHHIIIDGIEVYNDSGSAIWLADVHNITVRNCYLHDIRAKSTGAITVKDHVTDVTDVYNITIENNTFENIGGSDVNDCNLNHSLYISDGVRDSTIRNNVFKETTSCQSYPLNIYGHPGATYPKDIDIYNNVVYHTSGTYRNPYYINGSGHQVYNNTFYIDCTGVASGNCKFGKSYGATFKNNIFYAVNPPGSADLMKGNIPSATNYNLWYPVKDPDDQGGFSRVGNPLFSSIALKKFTLQSASPAIDAGIALPNLKTDINKSPRDTKPDIGAYEYGSGSTYADTIPPGRPTGLVVAQ